MLIGLKPKILIIDDSVETTSMLALLLSDMAQIFFAATAAKGWEIALSVTPDLVLLDVELPDMNGLTLCRRLKADPALSAIPIVIITAGNDIATEVRSLESGAADFFAKPLVAQVVQARIKTQLQLRQQSMRLLELAQLDGLTGVFNRRYFDTTFSNEVARHRRNRCYLTVGLLDVDHFKAYNDRLGHLQGDTCLRLVAKVLAGCMRRPSEVLARFGGEEFAVIAPDVGPHDVEKLGAWIREQINSLRLPHPCSDVGPHLSISMGFASMVPSDAISGEFMLAMADQALYQAKHAGRDRFVLAGEQQCGV